MLLRQCDVATLRDASIAGLCGRLGPTVRAMPRRSDGCSARRSASPDWTSLRVVELHVPKDMFNLLPECICHEAGTLDSKAVLSIAGFHAVDGTSRASHDFRKLCLCHAE